MKNSFEESLVRQLNEGDERALKCIFDQYYKPLTLFAAKYLGNVEDAKEVVQNFFVRLWLRREEVRISFSLKMYLYQSVRNASLNHLATNKVAQRRMENYEHEEWSKDNALDRLILAEQEALLMQAVDRLPERCREIFLLSRMRKLSNRQISEQLNISIKTVETQISIALKRLMKSLITLSGVFAVILQ